MFLHFASFPSCTTRSPPPAAVYRAEVQLHPASCATVPLRRLSSSPPGHNLGDPAVHPRHPDGPHRPQHWACTPDSRTPLEYGRPWPSGHRTDPRTRLSRGVRRHRHEPPELLPRPPHSSTRQVILAAPGANEAPMPLEMNHVQTCIHDGLHRV